MHFQGILKNPNTPKLILFQKQGAQISRRDFSNDKFVNNSQNSTFYKDFVNKLSSNHELQNMETDSKRSLIKRTESQLWNDFNSHFNKSNRPREIGFNHQDFIDASILPKVGNNNNAYSVEREPGQQYMMGQERLINHKRNLQKMRMKSISIPMNAKSFSHQRNGKIHQKNRMSQLAAETQVLVFQNQSFPHHKISSPLRDTTNKSITRVLEERRMFVVLDGSNIFDEDFKFSYIELSDKLSKLVPNKIWNAQETKRMNLYEKLQLAAPSEILQKQNLKELLQDVSNKINCDTKSLFLLNGTKIRSLITIPLQSRILVVSGKKEFVGIKGLDFLEENIQNKAYKNFYQGDIYNQQQQTQIQSWLSTACQSWIRNNKADKTKNNYVDTNQNVIQDQEKKIVDLEKIQEKQHAIQIQDQKLIDSFQLNLSARSMKPMGSPSKSTSERLWESYTVNEQLEEEVVKIICQKVIKMREAPLLEAAQSIRSSHQQTRFKSNDFAKRIAHTPYSQGRTMRDMQMKTNVNATFTEMKHSPTLQDPEETEHLTKGKVTFKVRRTNNFLADPSQNMNRSMYSTNKKVSPHTSHAVQQSQFNFGNKGPESMLKNEEIKEICERHRLTRKEVYDIRSQFTSMCMMSQEGMGLANSTQENLHSSNNHNKANQQQKYQGSDQGININYFIKNCQFLAGSLPHINQRILVAIGLDIENANAQVNWPTFLELYCIFEAGKIEKGILIKFWIKFFDQKLIGVVLEQEYLTLLEELVRGNSFKKANKTTKMFARMFQKMMETNDCLGENKEINDEKLTLAFQTDAIDIQILCSALGRQKLDSSLLNIQLNE